MSDAPQAFSFIQAVRRRAAMYVGDTGTFGLHHLACFLLDAVHEEYLEHACDAARVSLAEDGALVIADAGRPIPRDDLHRMLSTTAMGQHAPVRATYLAIVSALSSTVCVDVWDGSSQWSLRAEQGEIRGGVEEVQPPSAAPLGGRHGVQVTLTPDASIFGGAQLAPERLLTRARELAFLSPGLRVDFSLGGGRYPLHYPRGVVERLQETINREDVIPEEPLSLDVSWDDFRLRAAFCWTRWGPGALASYANTVHTRKHGAHVDGVMRGLRQALADVTGERLANISRDKLEARLTGLISLECPAVRLQFVGPTKELLGIEGLALTVARQVRPLLASKLRGHPVTPVLLERAVSGR